MWVAVNNGGKEVAFNTKPYRGDYYPEWINVDGEFVKLPKGTIVKLSGMKLTWRDKPIKITQL